ncbi:Serine-threonine kinase receptor-associated protein [Papilio machaon]|uniref:Serine-threonine kinase receptor-associated protein n=1 Tax=Papilio machaon TaxID=76193 RepID=A0A0N1PJC8_PAPMA|nr:Serine-threonine kinase receptor-associated protein [Papilio machaon]
MTTLKQVPLTCGGHTRPVVHLDFSDVTSDGFYLISACKDGKPMLRQGETGDWIGTFEGHKGAVWGVALTQNANLAASGAADFTAKLWDARYGEVVHTFDHEHIVKSVNFNADDTLLLTASNEKLIRVFDLNKPEAGGTNVSFYSSDTMRKMREFSVPTACYSASLAPGRATFVCGGEDLKVYKFDYNTGTELESNKGHFGPVHIVRWSPDGELYATGSEDGTVRLWQGVPGRVYGLWRRSHEPAPLANGYKELAAN